jgi:hypothetical protein
MKGIKVELGREKGEQQDSPILMGKTVSNFQSVCPNSFQTRRPRVAH